MRVLARTGIRLLLSTLICAAVLLAVELVVRARLPEIDTRNFFLSLFGEQPDDTPADKPRLFEGDPVVFWRLRPDAKEVIWDFTVVSTNADGLRYARPLEPKAPGTLRIVCIGDSVTFGYRVPLVFPDNPQGYDHRDGPYPLRLERLLAAANPGRAVEVVNLAVPGYSTHQGKAMLERFIDSLEPDLVIICFGYNDATERPLPDREVMPLDRVNVAMREVMSSSQALLHAWKWQRQRRGEGGDTGPWVPRVSEEEYVSNILAMAEEAQRAGAKVIVVGAVFGNPKDHVQIAARMHQYREALAQRMEQERIPYLQVPELTESPDPKHKSLFGEPIHPSSSGHQLMAERIAAFIAKHDLLPGWKAPT